MDDDAYPINMTGTRRKGKLFIGDRSGDARSAALRSTGAIRWISSQPVFFVGRLMELPHSDFSSFVF